MHFTRQDTPTHEFNLLYEMGVLTTKRCDKDRYANLHNVLQIKKGRMYATNGSCLVSCANFTKLKTGVYTYSKCAKNAITLLKHTLEASELPDVESVATLVDYNCGILSCDRAEWLYYQVMYIDWNAPLSYENIALVFRCADGGDINMSYPATGSNTPTIFSFKDVRITVARLCPGREGRRMILQWAGIGK